MKKQYLYLNWFLLASVLLLLPLSSCTDESAKRRDVRSVYMPDMFESRAYQAQTSDTFFNKKIGNKRPVGVIARGEIVSYVLPNTVEGYELSAGVKSPLEANEVNLEKATVLYANNCSICHGSELDGNGPLYKGGEGPYLAKPATLVGDVKYEAMSEGTMFHSIYYGKNLMGSYSSQLSQKEIWMVTAYIKSQQKVNQK